MAIGVDLGSSTTKGVVLEDRKILHRYSVQTSDAESSALETLESLLAKIEYRDAVNVVAVTGGGSRRIGDVLLGLPIKKVDEIKAIGLGGLLLTGRREALVASVGTGTALVAVYDEGRRINHVGGTGVGGGTILGLSKRMLGVEDFRVLENMASRGNPDKVDLTVADIAGGPVGIVPGEATASNFGRLTGEATKEDVAAGIFNMVSQVVGVLVVFAAKSCNLEENVVLVGRPLRSKIVSEVACNTAEFFGAKAFVPENCEYCAAIGAAGHVLLSEDGVGHLFKI